jgi:flavin reductase (DIM6/NTAB) family NADH-FMN oxidoreductase RutF
MNPRALEKLGYGLYVVSSKREDEINGQIANTIFQVSSEPPVVAVAINRQNLTREFIAQSGVLTGSILSQEIPLAFIGNFGFKSGRQIDKFKNVHYKFGETLEFAPIQYSRGYLLCRHFPSCARNETTILRRDRRLRWTQGSTPNEETVLNRILAVEENGHSFPSPK